MTVLISKPSLNLREELAALRNQGGYSEQAFHKNELVTNGTFDSNVSGWTLLAGTGGGAITLSANTILFTQGGTSKWMHAYQVISTVIGNTYTYSIDEVTNSGGVHEINVGTSAPVNDSNYAADIDSVAVNTAATYTITFTATTTTTYINFSNAGGSSATNSYDNISVYETDGTNVIHSLPNGWLPKDVFVNGLLKREGSGWDYTVYNDGTKYWIKPTVAPSATTTTTILGVRL